MIWMLIGIEIAAACVVVWHAIDRMRLASSCTRLSYVIAWIAAGSAAMGVISELMTGEISTDWHGVLMMTALALVAASDHRRRRR